MRGKVQTLLQRGIRTVRCRAGALWRRAGEPAALLVAVLVGRRVVVTNQSMYPLLLPGDRVVVDRRAFQSGPPQRGDLVLVEAHDLPGRRLLKLVAGLPGEQVAVARDALWIDGRRLQLPQPVVGSLPGSWQLGRDEYFLLSAAVAVGTDSRHFGPVPRPALQGRVRLVYLPLARRRWLPIPAVPLVVQPGDAG